MRIIPIDIDIEHEVNPNARTVQKAHKLLAMELRARVGRSSRSKVIEEVSIENLYS